jgi:2-methylisocitrate lyase-like PEP mutase family enzyme
VSAPDHVRRLDALLAADTEGRRTLRSVPGCWDGLTALLIERAGFEIAFLSGGGFAMTRLGRPDLGLVTATEVTDTIAAIRDVVGLPLIVDADTGFGNAINTQRTVRQFERAGASAIQLEDQTAPKRCGHMAGKSVVPLAEAVGKLKAALDARQYARIVARTDALAVEGLAAALDRADAYLEAGADLVFVEGPRTIDELQAIADRLAARVPLVHNLVEGGVSPTGCGEVLAGLGFAIALHPLLLLHGLIRQAPDWLATLRAERSTQSLDLAQLPDANALVGTGALVAAGGRYAG